AYRPGVESGQSPASDRCAATPAWLVGDNPFGGAVLRPGAGRLAGSDGRAVGPAALECAPQRRLPPPAKPVAQVFRQAPAGRVNLSRDQRHAIAAGRARREHPEFLLKHLPLRRHWRRAALDELEAHASGFHSRAGCPPALEILLGPYDECLAASLAS